VTILRTSKQLLQILIVIVLIVTNLIICRRHQICHLNLQMNEVLLVVSVFVNRSSPLLRNNTAAWDIITYHASLTRLIQHQLPLGVEALTVVVDNRLIVYLNIY